MRRRLAAAGGDRQRVRLRYAILFSGMSFRRHVNGLEFCYRTLVDRLGFAAENVCVLNYDSSLRAFGDCDDVSASVWPGDGTPYRMVVSGAGTRAEFQRALSVIAGKLTADDRVFINTTGHGGHHGGPRGPDLITYPHSKRYKRDDFCGDLALLPPHRSLTMLMSQCFSGGFIQAVLSASPAAATYIATATCERQQSFMEFGEPDWDSFQRNWVAAIAGHVTVHEAFQYATRPDVVNPYDSPQFGAHPPAAGQATLSD